MDQQEGDRNDSSSVPNPTAPTTRGTVTSPEPGESLNPPPSEDNNQTATSAAGRAVNARRGETNAAAPAASATVARDGEHYPPSSEHGLQPSLDTSPPFLTTGPPTTEAACGPGDSSIRVDMLASDSDDLSSALNRLSRVSRVLMPIQQIADASTQMYPSLFHPIGASGVIIYSDGSTTDVSGLTIPYFDPLREIAAGLMSVADPAGEQFEWNSLLESDTSSMSRPPGHMGDDYYIATYVDPDENSSILFTSMNPVSDVPYTTLEMLDGVEIDSTRGIVISAHPPENVTGSSLECNVCVQNSAEQDSTSQRDETVSGRSSHGSVETKVMSYSDSSHPSPNTSEVASISEPITTPSTTTSSQHLLLTRIQDPAATPLHQPSSAPETVSQPVTEPVTPEQDSVKNEPSPHQDDSTQKK